MYQFEITKGIICDMKRRFVSSSKQQKYEALMPSVSTVLIHNCAGLLPFV